MPDKTYLRSLIVLLLLILNPAIAADDLKPITLQLKWKHAFQFAGYYAAIEKGFYKDAGFEVSVREYLGERAPIDVLLQGDAEYAVSGADVVLHRVQGQPVIAMATIFQHSPYAFLVMQDSGISRVEHFAGKRVMIGTNSQDVELRAMLRRAGLMEHEYDEIPSNYDALSLVRHETDGFNAYVTDQAYTLRAAGYRVQHLLPKHYGVDFYGDILTTTEQHINEYPEEVNRFLTASLAGWRWALEHQNEAIDLILDKYNTQGLSREHLEYEASRSRELIQPLLVPIGFMNRERWNHIRNIFAELNLIDSDASIDGLLYNSEDSPDSTVHWLAKNWIVVAVAIVTVFIVSLLLLLFHVNRRYQVRTKELFQSERNYRTLVEYANVIHWKYNVTKDCFTYVSPQIKKILGYDPSSWHNIESWAQQIHPDDRETAIECCFLQSAAGKDHSFEYRCIDSSGKTIWIRDTVNVKMGRSGPRELIGFMEDISEYKERIQEQEQSRRELAQTRKMQALGQLTGGIAHDFNNLLAIILGHCDLMHHAPDHKKLPGHIKTIKTAAERGRDLVKNMLTYSRDEPVKSNPLQLAPIVHEQMQLLRATIPSTISIDVDIDNELPLIRADKLHIQQIILNLAINARDAMDGKGKISISARVVSMINSECAVCFTTISGNWVDLCVSDTGDGIDSDQIPQLFEPFYSTKPTGEGTGMGLAVISGILKQSHGHIVVKPNADAGKGTEFHVLFPLAYKSETSSNSRADSKINAPQGSGERILVVDDEPGLGEVMSHLLQSGGYRASVETDSRRVFRNIRQVCEDYQLVITDQTMPGISGLELIEHIRLHEPALPTILCTGFSDAVNRESARKLGITYLEKPINSKIMLTLVAKMISANSYKLSETS